MAFQDLIRFNTDQQSLIGRGDFGFVYRGTYGNKSVAIKRIHHDENYDKREFVPLNRKLKHENIVLYHLKMEDSEFTYLVMELCAGDLEEWIKGDYPGPNPGTPAEMMRQVTRGVQYLHSLKILHRDLKPKNILISMPDGVQPPKMKLADFGLCKALEDWDTSNASNSRIGTEGWRASECYRQSPEIGPKYTELSDIFTLGCVYAYTFTGGHHPFGNIRLSHIVVPNIINGTPNPANVAMVADESLKALIMRMISKDAQDRPQLDDILAHPIFVQ